MAGRLDPNAIVAGGLAIQFPHLICRSNTLLPHEALAPCLEPDAESPSSSESVQALLTFDFALAPPLAFLVRGCEVSCMRGSLLKRFFLACGFLRFLLPPSGAPAAASSSSEPEPLEEMYTTSDIAPNLVKLPSLSKSVTVTVRLPRERCVHLRPVNLGVMEPANFCFFEDVASFKVVFEKSASQLIRGVRGEQLAATRRSGRPPASTTPRISY